MISFGGALIVFKGTAMYGFFGTTIENFSVKKIEDIGTINGESVAIVNQELYFINDAGDIYGYNGSKLLRLSKHIKDDLDSYTKTDAVGINYDGNYLISFPTNSVLLRFDPDTIRVNDSGEGRAAFFKYTSYQVHKLIWFNGDGDTKALIGVKNTGSAGTLWTCENGNYYDESSTAISVKIQTKYYSFGSPQLKKHYARVKPDITASGTWSFVLKRDNGDATATVSIASGSGGGHYTTDVSVPYDLDGKNLAFYLANNTVNNASIYAIAVDIEGRVF